MEINLDLIKIRWQITLFRYLSILFAFLPVVSYDKIGRLTNTNFWSCWSLFWIILLIIQVLLLKRYKVIGQIKLTNENICVLEDDKLPMTYNSEQNLSIFIKYNGAKGEMGNYRSPLQLPIFSREGIGYMTIIKKNSEHKYNFIAKKISRKI